MIRVLGDSQVLSNREVVRITGECLYTLEGLKQAK